jgi:hypothetical protein
MRDVILYMSMSLDGFVGSDREHPGMAVPEGAELRQWKLDRISKAEATCPATRVARGDLATKIAAIKAEPGPDVIVRGGSRLHPPSNGAWPHHDRPLRGSGAALLHDSVVHALPA